MSTWDAAGSAISRQIYSLSGMIADGFKTFQDEFFDDGEEHFFEEDKSPEEIKEVLNRGSGLASDDGKTDVMKWLVAQMSKGINVASFFADVVKLVVSGDENLKQYVYIYLIHYCDYDQLCRDLALLSVNTFQQDMKGKNPRIRGLALKVLTSIRLPELWQLQLMAVQQCINDNVPFVRKLAIHALVKLNAWDPSQSSSFMDILEKAMASTIPLVLSSAIIAFNEICPTRFEMIDPVYRDWLKKFHDLEYPAQSVMLTLLMKYARTQFLQPVDNEAEAAARKEVESSSVPAAATVSKTNVHDIKILAHTSTQLDSFYGGSSGSEEENEEAEEEEKPKEVKNTPAQEQPKATAKTTHFGTDPDLTLLLNVASTAMQSNHSCVVLSAAGLLLHCAPTGSSFIANSVYALIWLLRKNPSTGYVVLRVLDEISMVHQSILVPLISYFFPRLSEPTYIITLKLRLLARLVTPNSVTPILKALKPFALHQSSDVVCQVIRTLLVIAEIHKVSGPTCLRVCRQILDIRMKDTVVANIALMAVGRLFAHAKKEEMNECIMWATHRILVECKLIPVYAELLNFIMNYIEIAGPLAVEVARRMTQCYAELDKPARLGLLRLLVKCCVTKPASKVEGEKGELIATQQKELMKYVLEMNCKDQELDIRVQARNVKALYFSDNEIVEKSLQNIFMTNQMPNSTSAPCYLGSYYVGSLSLTATRIINGFIPIPAWTTNPPSPDKRDPAIIAAKKKKEEEEKEKARKKAAPIPLSDDYEYYSYDESDKEEDGYSGYGYSDYSYSDDEGNHGHEKVHEAKQAPVAKAANEQSTPKVNKHAEADPEADPEAVGSDYSYSAYSYSENDV